MSRNITVDDIINELRSLTDEFNEDQLQAERDILPELNRAQERAYQILSRVYPEPLLTYVEVTGVTGYEYESKQGPQRQDARKQRRKGQGETGEKDRFE